MTRGSWALVALAFVLRLLAGLSSTLVTGGDAQEYLLLGRNLADGHGFSLAQAPPYIPSDFRMPGYPAVLAAVDWLGTGNHGIVIANSLLGALAVLAIALIARQVFPAWPRVAFAITLAAAIYPALVTYSAVAYSENLSVCALCWFVYIAFLQPIDRRWLWLLGLFVAGSVLVLSRAEGVAIVLIGTALALWLRRVPLRYAALALVVVLIAPAVWVARNSAETGRTELTDPLNRDVTLLLSFNDGSFSSPLYREGIALAHGGATQAERDRYHDAVVRYAKDALNDHPGSVLSYKAKSLLNFPFVPLVWTWSAGSDYSLSEAAQHPTARNGARLVWSAVLLAQYLLALVGLWEWWRRRRFRELAATGLYPALTLILAIPFHAEQRLWFGAGVLLLVPAAEGLLVIRDRARVHLFARQPPLPNPD